MDGWDEKKRREMREMRNGTGPMRKKGNEGNEGREKKRTGQTRFLHPTRQLDPLISPSYELRFG